MGAREDGNRIIYQFALPTAGVGVVSWFGGEWVGRLVKDASGSDTLEQWSAAGIFVLCTALVGSFLVLRLEKIKEREEAQSAVVEA